ncbi:hypothetical protein ACJ72_07659 [Emergomyces africanus]|uniref:Uncharacterized protein n=1 Tax=Emergomyces africanus TaxID=1955775 RepID=A0A1B7NMY8_9EURO|nr:hypothetical protein ACJ72_07659 [Emergomyces africanus]
MDIVQNSTLDRTLRKRASTKAIGESAEPNNRMNKPEDRGDELSFHERSKERSVDRSHEPNQANRCHDAQTSLNQKLAVPATRLSQAINSDGGSDTAGGCCWNTYLIQESLDSEQNIANLREPLQHLIDAETIDDLRKYLLDLFTAFSEIHLLIDRLTGFMPCALSMDVEKWKLDGFKMPCSRSRCEETTTSMHCRQSIYSHCVVK